MRYNIKVGERWLIGESVTETIKGTVRGDTTAVFSRMVGEMSAYDFADNRQEAASFDRITLCDYLRGIVERQNYGHYLWEIKVIPEDREEAKAQLPKRGEWQKAKPKGVVTYSDGYAECSHCHEAIWLGWGMNFCPNCGTQNRIIDPDDYDGAKMEVQDADK